jgi:hypothetical protein
VEADLLAIDLGHLPLALAQATAYILDLALNCASYRVRLHNRRHRLADLIPDTASLPDERQATVSATWSMSIERANRLRPVGLARPLLEVIAGSYDQDPYGYIQNGRFWSPVVESLSVAKYLAARLRRPVPQQHSEEIRDEIRDALYCLKRFSLISIQPAGHFYYIWTHPVLRRVVRDGLSVGRTEEVQHVVAEDVQFRHLAAGI